MLLDQQNTMMDQIKPLDATLGDDGVVVEREADFLAAPLRRCRVGRSISSPMQRVKPYFLDAHFVSIPPQDIVGTDLKDR